MMLLVVAPEGGVMLKEKFLLLLLSTDHWLCPRCRRMTAPTHNTLCHR
jgi:hypothetical protein